jgi:thymidylate kinase
MRERLKGKKADAIEQNGDSFFSYVLESYEDLALKAVELGQKCLILDSLAPVGQNIMQVIRYLKEVAFNAEELKQGNRGVLK